MLSRQPNRGRILIGSNNVKQGYAFSTHTPRSLSLSLSLSALSPHFLSLSALFHQRGTPGWTKKKVAELNRGRVLMGSTKVNRGYAFYTHSTLSLSLSLSFCTPSPLPLSFCTFPPTRATRLEEEESCGTELGNSCPRTDSAWCPRYQHTE